MGRMELLFFFTHCFSSCLFGSFLAGGGDILRSSSSSIIHHAPCPLPPINSSPQQGGLNKDHQAAAVCS
jgi:hypothetical protein